MQHLKVFFNHKESRAVGVAFVLLGFLFGNWATMIPYVKQQYQLNDSALGILLLCMPLGAMIFNPFAAILIQRFGMRKVTIASMFFISVAYSIPLSIVFFPIVPLGLILSGLGITALNVSMNTCASSIEQHEKINIMSTCHGLFSLGLMLGSLTGSTSQASGIFPGLHMALMGMMGVFMAIRVRPVIMQLYEPEKSSDRQEKFSLFLPKGALLMMIIISLCINFTEGTMADWTTLYMKEVVRTNPYFLGWGLAAYSSLMALGRFMGDNLIPRYGGNLILQAGAALTITGLGVAIFLPFTLTAVLGFALVGLGVSCGAPILYASAGRIPDLPGGTGLAIMNTFAMGGFLVGPVIIGFISNLTNLMTAFGFVVILGAVWLVFALRVRLY
jgi:MFS family permease